MIQNTKPASPLMLLRLFGWLLFLVLLVGLVAAGILVAHELRFSRLQAQEIARFADRKSVV